MDFAIILALLPALFWGSVGLVSSKMGGTAPQQTIGMATGALIFGLATMFAFVLPNGFYMGMDVWVVGLLSGLVWAMGMAFQFLLFKQMGVSLGVPLSTAGQIIMNALLAATMLGEWSNGAMWLVGIISIALVVTGAVFISKPDKAAAVKSNFDAKAVLYLVLSTVGFMLYFILPNFLAKIGYVSETTRAAGKGLNYMTAIVGPQGIGQFIGALIVVVAFRETSKMVEKPALKNIITGIVWGLGNIFMFISAANPHVGQTIATTLSQLNIIVGTFGGIYILKEKKSSAQMKAIVFGTILVVVGAMIIGNIHSFA
ncbi:GRP family sugar transporter [Fructobacillus sp. M1-13]|uniref:Glucose transporter n=1 Tax=Fructobacillus papyriferae TaxID=2713171 RepID=A0ABS5QRF9_9LACO|nr:GRP family sugar transporter [Fructobacillus papyriferae]MBS9335090.1 glucose transporter [Fructobacillus papyriferae]MCD2159424.1 GRP family sugar transporter [Fructobacillus papyriferae]